jgi:hypothetical protein
MKANVELNPYTETREIEKGGLFRKAKTVDLQRYNVCIKIEFTEEERATLTSYALWDHTAFSVPQTAAQAQVNDLIGGMPTEYPCPIKQLATAAGGNRQFDTSEEALDFQTEVKTKILPRVKELIVKHQGPVSSSETLEF